MISMTSTGFYGLPKKITLSIFQHLDKPCDIANATRVCRHWHSILSNTVIDQVLKRILQHRISQEPGLKKLLDKYPFILEFISLRELLQMPNPSHNVIWPISLDRSGFRLQFGYYGEHDTFSRLLQEFEKQGRSILTTFINNELAFIIRVLYKEWKETHPAVFVIQFWHEFLKTRLFFDDDSRSRKVRYIFESGEVREQTHLDWLARLLKKETCKGSEIGYRMGTFTMF